MSSAKEQISNEKMKAITELKNTVASLSIDIAEKVLKSEPKIKISEKFRNKFKRNRAKLNETNKTATRYAKALTAYRKKCLKGTYQDMLLARVEKIKI